MSHNPEIADSRDAVTRRTWIGSAVASTLLLVSGAGKRVLLAERVAPTGMLVYASPDCGCCRAWIEHVEANGFVAAPQFVNDVTPIKRKRGVPEKLWSCHTAVVGDYAIEGHVPADLIHKLLHAKAPIAGLAAPGMPNGAPGMEGPVKDRYEVISFTRTGRTEVFATR